MGAYPSVIWVGLMQSQESLQERSRKVRVRGRHVTLAGEVRERFEDTPLLALKMARGRTRIKVFRKRHDPEAGKGREMDFP